LGGSDFLGGCFLLSDTHPVCIHIIYGFDFTETNALRISITEIALEILPVNNIKTHSAEGTDRYAGTAADTNIVIYHYPAEFLIPGNGLYRADDHTGSVLTLLAGHGNIKAF
jgi:hypothetical protein